MKTKTIKILRRQRGTRRQTLRRLEPALCKWLRRMDDAKLRIINQPKDHQSPWIQQDYHRRLLSTIILGLMVKVRIMSKRRAKMERMVVVVKSKGEAIAVGRQGARRLLIIKGLPPIIRMDQFQDRMDQIQNSTKGKTNTNWTAVVKIVGRKAKEADTNLIQKIQGDIQAFRQLQEEGYQGIMQEDDHRDRDLQSVFRNLQNVHPGKDDQLIETDNVRDHRWQAEDDTVEVVISKVAIQIKNEVLIEGTINSTRRRSAE